MRRAGKEFGDWQTSPELAARVCARLVANGISPATVLEPTCGVGRFIRASLKAWPQAKVRGVDIQAGHVSHARANLPPQDASRVQLDVGDVFASGLLERGVPRPLLCLGNPPWVTSAALGALGSDNLPDKLNVDALRGMDALTGKANFDLAEAVVLRMLNLMGEGDALAMLVKISTAQRTLLRVWKRSPIGARIYRIDAGREFGASVEACLLVLSSGKPDRSCAVYPALESDLACDYWEHNDGRIVVRSIGHTSPDLPGNGAKLIWRSGVKHDAAKVLEIKRGPDGCLRNGFGEAVEIEDDLLFPLMKSSDVANGRYDTERFLLVPQRSPKEDTSLLAGRLPKTLEYLVRHSDQLDGRKSSIYRKRPRFSVFGVGPYTFSEWKVAVSGLYGNFRFEAIGPRGSKPVVFDDTVNLVQCGSENEARSIAEFCNSEAAQAYLRARVLPGAKRPLTVDLLRSLAIPTGREQRIAQGSLF